MTLSDKNVYTTCAVVFAASAGILYIIRRIEREIDHAAAGGFVFD